jgi:hypothetical protein
MQHRSTYLLGLDNAIASRGTASRQWRFLVVAAVCVTGMITGGSRSALAQTAGNVGASCRENSDCKSLVCHPATHLCMISAAAAQPASMSFGANPDPSPVLCRAPNDRCTPKTSGGGRVGASCRVNSDCMSDVCHPATHLCMVSAAAAQPSAMRCNGDSDCDSGGVQHHRPLHVGTVGASN